MSCTREVRIAAAALLLPVLSALLPAAASAHQVLLGAEPAAGATVIEAPRELRLRFQEPVQLPFTRIELIGPAGQQVALGTPAVAPDSASVLTVPIEGGLQPGGYTVRWATASRDGHPARRRLQPSTGLPRTLPAPRSGPIPPRTCSSAGPPTSPCWA